MYFNTKYFKLKSTDDHLRLSFNNMLTVFDRKTTDRPDKIGVLRYYSNGTYVLSIFIFIYLLQKFYRNLNLLTIYFTGNNQFNFAVRMNCPLRKL